MRFVLLAAALSVALGADTGPREIVRRAVANDEGRNAELALGYDYLERSQTKNLDGKGRVLSTSSKTYEMLMIAGTPYRLLVEDNGRQITAEEKRQQETEIRRVVEARRNEAPAQRSERLAEFKRRLDRYRKAIREIPDAFVFRLVGEEAVHSRPAFVIEATPRPGYQPVDRYSRLFKQLKGRLWIDKSDYQWARVDAELQNTVTFGWILLRIHEGSKVKMTQVRQDNGVWLPEEMWYRVSVRIGLVRAFVSERETIYSGYRLANSDPRLAPVR